jgi:Fe-S-cluster-containing dehydrogenase component
MYFGDLDDPESEVSALIRENDVIGMHEELGTGPTVYYIPRKDE